MGRGKRKKKAVCVDRNGQKETLLDHVKLPSSLGNNACKLLVLDPTVSTANSLRTNRPKKPKWKESCFIRLSEEELAKPKDIKSDPRPILRYHINCLLIAAGWLIGRRRRNSKYHGIGEYVYKSPAGRPIREFHRAWRMCGESLLPDAIFSSQTDENMQWADMTEFWYGLSHTIKMIEENFNVLVADSSMARLWCILDPYANVVFIEKTFRLLKEGIAVKATRTMLIESDARPKAKHPKVSGYGRSSLNPRLAQGWDYSVNDINSVDMPGQVGSGVSSEHTESTDNSKYVWPRRAESKSWNKSDMELDHFIDRNCPARESSSKRPSKKSKLSSPRDDDLLISAIMKSKNVRATKKRSNRITRPLGKRKTPKGSCKLLPRSFKKGGKQAIEGKWSLAESRTVLSWMIHCNAISLNDEIQYRDTDTDVILKDGVITRGGILCSCCHQVLSISELKCHAGFKSNLPCMNLFMKSGKPFILCQLEAWSSEFRARQMPPQINRVDEMDHNDDSCGCCGDVGELLCCDSCPSAFHMRCLFEQELPEGSWYCPRCRCQICGDLVTSGTSDLLCGLKCQQCEHKYHKTCMEGSCMQIGLSSAAWFCGDGCHKVYTGLESRIGLKNYISNGFSWTLLRCISSDHKTNTSPHAVALEAECNSKLAVAITILEECFLPMVDTRTGISMIPQVIFNLGSHFARLDYSGFYTVVLEEDDAIMCVASIRIHGTEVAELPLIATCSRNRRRGICRRLVDSIERMLISLNIKKLVLSAIPELLETWVVGFGFEPLDEDEKQSLSMINLMVFPCSIWLKKTLTQGTGQSDGTPEDVMSNTSDGGADNR